MNRSHTFTSRVVWLAVLMGVFLFLSLSGAKPSAASQQFTLDWSQISFVNGMSALQTFPNVAGSGVTMTTEFRLLDANFNDLGLYVPLPTDPDPPIPRTYNGANNYNALGVRDISATAHPTAGYILTRITFSQDITINDLWMEPFYHWQPTGNNVMKHAALQAFDGSGNSITPVSFDIYIDGAQPDPNVSNMVITPHPGNGKNWWRSEFQVGQNRYSGATNIDYGNKPIRELHWYSWGLDPVNPTVFRHVLGSTLLGGFVFTLDPTAVSLLSTNATANTLPAMPVLLAALIVGLATVGVSWRKARRA